MVVGSKRGRLAVLAATRGGGDAAGGRTPKKKKPKLWNLEAKAKKSSSSLSPAPLPPVPLNRSLSFGKLVKREESFAAQADEKEEPPRVYTPSKSLPRSPLSHFKVAKRRSGGPPRGGDRTTFQRVDHERVKPPSFSPSVKKTVLQPTTPERPERSRSLAFPAGPDPPSTAPVATPSPVASPGPVGGAGLRNRGNTCYMNAVLSVLIRTPSFVSSLAARVGSGSGAGAKAVTALRDLAAGVHRPFAQSPAQSLRVFRDWNQQQDAHEFFVRVLERVDEACAGVGSGGVGEPQSPRAMGAGPCSRAFLGSVEHEYTCSRCQHGSSSAELFNVVTLPAGGGEGSVQALLDAYFSPEQMEKDCEGCGGKSVPHQRRPRLSKLPEVLVVHVKRLTYGGGKLQKNYAKYAVEPRVEVGDYCSARDEAGARNEGEESLGPKTPDQAGAVGAYSLYGAVSHFGGASSGHYVAHVGKGDRWNLFNDSVVTSCSWGEVEKSLRDTSFMLFYRQSKGSLSM